MNTELIWEYLEPVILYGGVILIGGWTAAGIVRDTEPDKSKHPKFFWFF